MSFNSENYKKVEDLSIIQNMLCDLMQQLHNICEDHGLVYNIFAGTLLGAVRHQGIIPWDDDIDITMPRPDYEKLISILKNNPSDKYYILTSDDENYIYPFAKFCAKDTVLIEKFIKKEHFKLGLYIDIFPLDGMPQLSEKDIAKLYARAKKYKFLLNASTSRVDASPTWWKKPFVIYRWLRRAILGICGYKYYLKKQIKITRTYSFEECDKAAFISQWVYGPKSIISKKDYYNRKLYKFGNYEFWGVKDSDTELTKLYGDYMTPPPVEARQLRHNYDLFIKK